MVLLYYFQFWKFLNTAKFGTKNYLLIHILYHICTTYSTWLWYAYLEKCRQLEKRETLENQQNEWKPHLIESENSFADLCTGVHLIYVMFSLILLSKLKTNFTVEFMFENGVMFKGDMSSYIFSHMLLCVIFEHNKDYYLWQHKFFTNIYLSISLISVPLKGWPWQKSP